MRLGNQSGPGHFLWCFSSRTQRGTEERREMFHSFCKYLGQDFLKLASWYLNILSSQEAAAEDPIPFQYCLCLFQISALRMLLLQYWTSSQAAKEMQNKTVFHIKGELVEECAILKGLDVIFLFYTQLSVLVNSTNILIFLTSQFFTL